MTPSSNFDAIILGGGPAGSAAAIELALAGRRVAVIERSLAAHDKVCGDFLSSEALSSLSSLGLNLPALGAVPIHNVRLTGSLGVSSAELPFAAQSLTRRALDEALLQLASAARALVLRGHMAESLHRTGNLWRVAITGPNYAYTLTAPHILLATGKHDLRGLPRPRPGPPANSFAGVLLGTHADLVGLKIYLRLAPDQLAALHDTIELFLLNGGYGGLSLVEKPLDPQNTVISAEPRASIASRGASADPQNTVLSTEGPRSAETQNTVLATEGPRSAETQNTVISTEAPRSTETQNTVISTEAAEPRSGETPVFHNSLLPTAETNPANLCFVIDRKLLHNAGRGWDSLAAFLSQTPHLRMRLRGAEPLLARPLAISPIPYGLLRRHAIAENLWAIGDQVAVIPSFTGDGLALALHSGRFAAQTLLAGQTAHHFHAQLYRQLRHQLSLATMLSRGLVSQPQRTLLELTARLFPSTLRAVASHTRLPPEYLITRLPKNSCAAA